MSNYFIKPEYKVSIPADYHNLKNKFWTQHRIEFSKYYQWHAYKYASKLLRKNSKLRTVIDIGCGTCSKLDTLIVPFCASVTGIDVFRDKKTLKCSDKIDYLCVDVENDELNAKYDFILCIDVIEHVIDPDKLLRFIKNVAHSESLIIFSTPERDALRGQNCYKSDKPDHIREWNKNEFYNYISHSGFIVIEHFIAPVMKLIPKNNEVCSEVKAIYEKCNTINTSQIILSKIFANCNNL